MRFESVGSLGAGWRNPKVIAVVVAVSGALYALEGLIDDDPGRPNTADRVFVLVASLFAAHIVWSLGRMRRRRVVEEIEEAGHET